MSRLRKSQRRERGTILLLATITILVVVGMLALAVDIGYLMSGRGQLQNAMDAAALAGAQGSHAAIDAPNANLQPQTATLVRQFANQYAQFNSIRKVGETAPLALSVSDIIFEPPAGDTVNSVYRAPRIIVKHRTALPTIFANIFGFSNFNISTGAIASTTLVEGGTGMISGCWRPILIPDTFFDASHNVWALGQNFKQTEPTSISASQRNCIKADGTQASGEFPCEELGDYYISRFSAPGTSRGGEVDTSFVYPLSTSLYQEPTSIRDTRNNTDLKYLNGALTGNNLIGQRIILRPTDYLVVDFAGTPGIKGDFPSDFSQQISKGCCVPVRVGQLVKLWPQYDSHSFPYPAVWAHLNSYINSIFDSSLGSPEVAQYRYSKSTNFPTPNTSPKIIPVLMCNPFKFSKNIGQAIVTNIGAFYAEDVKPDGTMVGFFVREVVTAGIPLDAAVANVPRLSALPVSVSLTR